MRFFISFSSQKTITRFLRYRNHHHLHRGFLALTFPRDSTASKDVGSQFSRYSTTSAILNDTHSKIKDDKKVNLEIISRETIKPSSPTPQHSRIFNLSIIDQSMVDVYSHLAIFLPNNDKASITHVLNKRSKLLKQTLSEILTRFYPFAGEIKDNLHIECNDKGVRFVEARVYQTLQEFLHDPHDLKVRQLLPTEPSSRNHVASIQANIFECGGIVISASMSHKLIDGHSYFLFMNEWAAAARGSPEKITPSFIASELFPNNPSLQYSFPPNFTTVKELVTKRFVFSPTSLDSLKAATNSPTSSSSSHGPTRTESTGALIWKAVSRAATTIRAFEPQSPHFLITAVNLRHRSVPPLPKETIGNLATVTAGVCFPKTEPDLATLMSEMRGSIAQLNAEFIEARKGKEGHEKWAEGLKMMNSLVDIVDRGDYIAVTSLLNSKVREIDFGWGKPIWFYSVEPGTSKMATLNDTIKMVGGVEAAVSLSPEEMEIFESDPEVLSYATVDPSPLLHVS